MLAFAFAAGHLLVTELRNNSIRLVEYTGPGGVSVSTLVGRGGAGYGPRLRGRPVAEIPIEPVDPESREGRELLDRHRGMLDPDARIFQTEAQLNRPVVQTNRVPVSARFRSQDGIKSGA